MYLLSDIKAKALAAHGSWQKLRANLQWHVDWREEYDAKERARTQVCMSVGGWAGRWAGGWVVEEWLLWGVRCAGPERAIRHAL